VITTRSRVIPLRPLDGYFAANSKITFAGRHELAHSSLKQHGGLTAAVIKNL